MIIQRPWLKRINAIMIREFREIILDRTYLAMVFFAPMFIMITFGYGLKMDVQNVPLGVYDRDNSPLSRRYYESFASSDSFELVSKYYSDITLMQDLQRLNIRAGIIIGEGFSKHVSSGRKANVQILLDGTFPARGQVMQSYARAIHESFLAKLLVHGPDKPPGQMQLAVRMLYNPELKSSNFIVPGVLATLLMLYPALLTAGCIVRETESQSILSIYCCPIERWEFLAGKLLPYWLLSLVTFLVVFGMAVFVFQVPYRGGITLLVVATAGYLACTCGIGLLISVLARTQVTAIMITAIMTILPAFTYSGFFVPLSTATPSVRLISFLVPASYYLDIIRGLFLKGTGWAVHWPNVVAICVYAMVLYGIAYMKFKKRI